VFASWTVLNLAVDNQWGGPMAKEKSIEMFDYTVRLFKGIYLFKRVWENINYIIIIKIIKCKIITHSGYRE
jgi:hypothetical protein